MQKLNKDEENPYVLKHYHTILEESESSGALYLGDIIAAENMLFLKNNNVTCILSVAKTRLMLPTHFPVNILTIPVEDSPIENLKKHFEACFKFINENRIAKKNVLVHCMAGVSRSSTIVIGYLMNLNNFPYKEAYEFVKKRRTIISPNGGFMRQLKEYELELKDKGNPKKDEKQKETSSVKKITISGKKGIRFPGKG